LAEIKSLGLTLVLFLWVEIIYAQEGSDRVISNHDFASPGLVSPSKGRGGSRPEVLEIIPSYVQWLTTSERNEALLVVNRNNQPILAQ
jgi:hypothetical protein